MFKVPEKLREKVNPLLKTTEEDGNNGLFIVPHNKIKGYCYACYASDKNGWELVVVSLYNVSNKNKKTPLSRYPTIDEILHVRSLFWGKEDIVGMFITDVDPSIGVGDMSVKLWRVQGQDFITPNSEKKSENG